MPTDHRAKLASIKRFDQLIAYLRDEMGWPIDNGSDFEDLTFEYSAEELGIDPKTAAKIQEIKRLRPLSPTQPWGIFFVKFEPKRVQAGVLRSILGRVVIKKRASANRGERQAWAADDLLFISAFGAEDERRMVFAHFSQPAVREDLPVLKVVDWDHLDTELHLDDVARKLTTSLAWPVDREATDVWRKRWQSAFELRPRQSVDTSKQLSIRLAELARAIRGRIRTALAIETDKGPLTRLMKAFQEALVHDLDADGFADMYAQTIAYGLLSARIADPQKKTADDFAAHMRTNPFLRELMETFLKVGGRRGKAGGPGIDFDELGVSEVVELLDAAKMDAVVRDFGDRNPQEDPVIHFYELFLKEYDAKKRMQRGVFYTPRPVVSYIVRSVDELLRTEFGLADGIADTTTWGEMAERHRDLRVPEGFSPEQDFVQILDPATGTGTFLVEVINLIHKTLVTKWKKKGHGEKKIDALWNEYVPKHLLTRLHGYELLMAPYAIAHLKIGLKLYETGYRFGSDERARVYLTNALEPAHEFSGRFEFAIPALADEAEAVNEIKQGQRFSVVIGNPPYSAVSSNLTDAARSLVEPYRVFDGERIVEKGALQFEKNLNDDYVKFLRFAETKVERHLGIVGFISNNGYLEAPTLRGMRQHLARTFDSITVIDLHGDSDRRERAADGSADENVFDIKRGVAVALLRRTNSQAEKLSLKRADIFGDQGHKYTWLDSHIVDLGTGAPVHASGPLFLFVEQDQGIVSEYSSGVAVDELFIVSSSGFESGRDELLLDFTEKELVEKVAFFSTAPADEVRERFSVEKAWGQSLFERRRSMILTGGAPAKIMPILMYPYDWRYCFYRKDLLKTNSWSAGQHLREGRNAALMCMRQVVLDEPFNHVGVSPSIVNNRAFASQKGKVAYFPLIRYPETSDELFAGPIGVANLRDAAASRLLHVEGAANRDPWRILRLVIAQFFSNTYRQRYRDFLIRGFPRAFRPKSANLEDALVGLGAELIDLQLMESSKLGSYVTTLVGAGDFQVEKPSYSEETVWIDKAKAFGFKGVPEDVWNFHIGGYQVCEKWLKDRKGRTLSKDDIAHYQKIVVALSETMRLMKEIDAVIEQHGGWPGAFQTGEARDATAKVLPFRPRTVEPKPEERYVTCVPLVPLKAAAGAFGDPQHIEDAAFEWVAIDSSHRLRSGMFVAQVVGKSMEPAIPDGAWCIFRAPVEGTRQGKTVLVQLHDATDPESGERYTVKRYGSEKARTADLWQHERITLSPLNPDFPQIVLNKEEREFQVIAEFVAVLSGEEASQSSGDQTTEADS